MFDRFAFALCAVQTFFYNSILITSLEFECAVRDFLYPWHWLLMDFNVIIVRNSSCGKVMFSQVSVHGERGVGVRGRRDGYCSGRYASYWNAFL